MGRIERILLGTAGVVVAGLGITYMLRLNRLSSELESETKVFIHKIDETGIELTIKVKLKNPSGATLKMKHPFVKIISGQSTIASSEVKNTDVTISKFSEQELEPIRIRLGILNLVTTAPRLVKEWRETGKLNLIVDTVTTINDRLPYTKRDYITLGSRA